MTARIIDGTAVAARLRAGVASQVAALPADARRPGLAVVLVGESPASQVYVRNKGVATRKAGMLSTEHRLSATASEAEVLALVERLNADPAVDGVLVQLPLPDHVRAARILSAIDPDKDVDGFHALNVGRLWGGEDGLVPCTPRGCMKLILEVESNLAGRTAVVIGRSGIVGKPMTQLLLAADCTVTIAHSRTRDLPAVCRQADILISAVGTPGLVKAGFVKPGAIVIDVGINRLDGEDGASRLVGDVAFDEVAAVAGAITPVPGGVGPMTIACLLENTLIAYGRRNGPLG
ncbi:MAG: bifunctional methylenetetrahydrofolate dehydrogenase/methenyltetrahydrofolate cyclohydrolase FolD [Caulobacteraceae bacterium]